MLKMVTHFVLILHDSLLILQHYYQQFKNSQDTFQRKQQIQNSQSNKPMPWITFFLQLPVVNIIIEAVNLMFRKQRQFNIISGQPRQILNQRSRSYIDNLNKLLPAPSRSNIRRLDKPKDAKEFQYSYSIPGQSNMRSNKSHNDLKRNQSTFLNYVSTNYNIINHTPQNGASQVASPDLFQDKFPLIKKKSANYAPKKHDSICTQLQRRLPSERSQTLISFKEKWFSRRNLPALEKSCRQILQSLKKKVQFNYIAIVIEIYQSSFINVFRAMLASMVLKVEVQLWTFDIAVQKLRNICWKVICKRYLCNFSGTVVHVVRGTKRGILSILLLEFFLFAHLYQCFFSEFKYFCVYFWLEFPVALLLTLSKSDHDQYQSTHCSNNELMKLIILQNIN